MGIDVDYIFFWNGDILLRKKNLSYERYILIGMGEGTYQTHHLHFSNP